MIVDLLAFPMALSVLLACLDRLRQINWRTARPKYVALYLLMTLWALGLLYDAFAASVELYQLAGVLASMVWLWSTRNAWKAGPPAHVVTQPGDLGPPLERRFGERRASK